ncbi:hypothetical protein KQI84_08655 [bacterium]|nr:hypothetical protein [bacterium]
MRRVEGSSSAKPGGRERLVLRQGDRGNTPPPLQIFLLEVCIPDKHTLFFETEMSAYCRSNSDQWPGGQPTLNVADRREVQRFTGWAGGNHPGNEN